MALTTLDFSLHMRTVAILLFGILSANFRPSNGETDDPAALLKTCWNEGFDPSPRSFVDYLAGRPPSLFLEDIWWSTRKSTVPITVFTQASRDRLSMVEAQCRDYSGPLTVAVYVPLIVYDLGPEDNTTRLAQEQLLQRGASAVRTRTSSSSLRRRGRLLQEVQQTVMTDSGALKRRNLQGAEVPIAEQLSGIRAELQALFDRMESGGGDVGGAKQPCCCQLRLLLFSERIVDRQMAAIMPTNTMRNAAMVAVQTPLAAMFDVDLGMSASINGVIKNETWVKAIMDEAIDPQPKFFIPTAWETNNTIPRPVARQITEAALRGSKEELINLWKNGTLQIFQKDVCPVCHVPFNHARWAQTNTPYYVNYQQWFEPWGILWRFHDPGYDERFRGWYYNKVSYLETLGLLWGFKFVVMPDFWLVHRPHPKVAVAELHHGKGVAASNADAAVQAFVQVKKVGRTRDSTAYEHFLSYVKALSVAVRSLLAQGKGYAPQLNPQLLHCRAVLPWWQVPNKPWQKRTNSTR